MAWLFARERPLCYSISYRGKERLGAVGQAGKGRKNLKFLDKLPWGLLIIGCLTLGLAPFFPPHIWEKLVMLSRGELVRPIDWFDLFYHSIPWVLLILKAVSSGTRE